MNLIDNRTILVIDDDATLTFALKMRLGSMGYRCLTASSGDDGLNQFRREHVDLIISDLNMLGGDGVTMAETVRLTSTVPIVFVTGYRDEFKRQLRRITNVTTLRKPFHSQDLLELITAAIGESPAPPLPANTEVIFP